MGYNPGQGEIITIRDFIDMIVYYTMQPEPDYQSKITIICSDGFRMNVFKDTTVGMIGARSGYVYLKPDKSSSGIPSNSWIYKTTQLRNNGGALYNGVIPYFYTKNGPSTLTHSTIIKILDPADNTTFDGVENHTFTGTMPTPGELISIDDIVSFLNNTSSTIYNSTDVFVYEWENQSYTNSGGFNPNNVPWYNPGGPGWVVLNSWYYSRLDNPNSYGVNYDALSSNLKLSESQYICSDQLQTIASNLYQAVLQRNKGTTETIHVLSCHSNCHSSCHCARW